MLSENTVKESLGVTGAVKLRLMQKLKDEINSDYPCISRMEEIIEEIVKKDTVIDTKEEKDLYDSIEEEENEISRYNTL